MPSTACSNCSAPIEPDARFCGSCGHKLTQPIAAQAAAPAAPPQAAAPQKAAPPATASPAQAASANATIVDLRAPILAAASMAAAPASASAHRPNGGGTPAPTPATVPSIPVPGTLLGRVLNERYQVLRKIGEGGFGSVYEGIQVATGREVALKVLHPHNVSDATVVGRFRREAEACSKLRSPHTVTLFDFDETEDGILYLAMELVRGRSLQHLQRAEGPVPPDRVLRILDQACQALGEAHEQGIVHRDMKPENVMVEVRAGEDFVKVLDFGIAKIVSGDAAKNAPALTAFGQTVGTLEFMSPEQLRGRALDGRSDIYGLGMMSYELLTGELPFKNAKAPTEVIQFHLEKPPPPPSSLRPELDIPSSVDELVVKMVAKSRDDRHADAGEVRAHIREILESLDRGGARNRMLRIAGIAAGILAAIGIVVFLLAR